MPPCPWSGQRLEALSPGFTRCGQRWLGLSGCRGAQGFLASQVWVHTLVTCFCEMTKGPPTRLLRGPLESVLRREDIIKWRRRVLQTGPKRGHWGSRIQGAPACRVGLFFTPGAPAAPPLHTQPSDRLPSHPHTHKGSESRRHRCEQTCAW